MENIIEYSYDGGISCLKVMRLAATVIGLVCIIVLVFDLSSKVITYFDDDVKFELSYDDLRKFRNLKSKDEMISEGLEKFSLDHSNPNEDINYRKNLTYFTNNITKHKYKGIWKTKQSFGELEKKEGVLKLFVSAVEKLEGWSLKFEIYFLDGSHFDKFIILSTIDVKIVKNSSIWFDHNFFSSSNILSNISTGAILEASMTKKNFTELNLTWVVSGVDNETTITKLKGNLNVGGVEIEFDVAFDNGKELHQSILIYSLIVTLLSTLQLFSTIWLKNKIQDSHSKIMSLSLITVSQNIVWNAYGCFMNVLFSTIFSGYFFLFFFPALIYFVNFACFELRLLFIIWKNQNNRFVFDESRFRSKLIRFYLYFYFSLFISLFFVTKFFFEIEYITFAIALTWIPQMVHNYQHHNIISLPLLNIVLISLNKLAMPIYFRGGFNNFLQISSHSFFSVVFISIIAVEVGFLYFQSIYGPKFFLPRYLTGKPFDYYKTKEDILNMFNESEFKECIICLLNITDDPLRISKGNDFTPNGNLIKRKNYCLKGPTHYLLDFHKVIENQSKKPYMVTPCNHVFHSFCLEKWFAEKKECPTCRSQELE